MTDRPLRHLDFSRDGGPPQRSTSPPRPAPPPRRCVTIAIDFDCTFTADRQLWRLFINSALQVGHRVLCVTERSNNRLNRELLQKSFGENIYRRMRVVWCDRAPKRIQTQVQGYRVDIWIDDLPEVVGASSAVDVIDITGRFNHVESLPLT